MKSSIPRDTSSEAMAKQDEILRGLGPAGRAAMAFELSDNLRTMVEAGVRSRHPDWEESEVRSEGFQSIPKTKIPNPESEMAGQFAGTNRITPSLQSSKRVPARCPRKYYLRDRS